MNNLRLASKNYIDHILKCLDRLNDFGLQDISDFCNCFAKL